MPDGIDKDDKNDDAGSATPATPTPDFVTREELRSQAEALAARIEGMIAGFNANRAGEPAAPAPRPSVSLDEINEAVSKGEGAAERIAALVDAKVSERLDAFNRDNVDPIRTYGLSNLAAIAKAQALSGKTYAKRYDKEIDAYMAKSDPRVSGSVEAWQAAYSLAVGMHLEEIQKETAEAAARKAAETRTMPEPTGSAAMLKDDDGTDLPSLESLAGPEGLKVLRDKGISDLDALAKRMGYKDSREYMKVAKMVENYDKDLI